MCPHTDKSLFEKNKFCLKPFKKGKKLSLQVLLCVPYNLN